MALAKSRRSTLLRRAVIGASRVVVEAVGRHRCDEKFGTRTLRCVAGGASVADTFPRFRTPRRSATSSVTSFRRWDRVTEVDDLVAPKDEVVRFIGECMRKAGTTDEDADVVAHHLMTADYRGHLSHGMNRMRMYVEDIRSRLTDPTAKPEILTDFQAIALVDGKNALGQVVGNYSMKLAIEKAREFGIGMVTARGSNHYGIAGYYSLMAMKEGLVGFSCTNTSPLMAPTRSGASALGTNPLSVGMAATETSNDVVLDMATTAVALGKIEIAIRKDRDIPSGWALGNDGETTRNAEEAFRCGTLMPLGGAEENSGYKGYGLALMVEILCGIIGDANYGPNIRSWKSERQVANLGQCFIAINAEAFAPGSKNRLNHLVEQLRALPRAAKDGVLVAGDPEREAMKKTDENGGIAYHVNQINSCIDVANELDVEPMKLIKIINKTFL